MKKPYTTISMNRHKMTEIIKYNTIFEVKDGQGVTCLLVNYKGIVVVAEF